MLITVSYGRESERMIKSGLVIYWINSWHPTETSPESLTRSLGTLEGGEGRYGGTFGLKGAGHRFLSLPSPSQWMTFRG